MTKLTIAKLIQTVPVIVCWILLITLSAPSIELGLSMGLSGLAVLIPISVMVWKPMGQRDLYSLPGWAKASLLAGVVSLWAHPTVLAWADEDPLWVVILAFGVLVTGIFACNVLRKPEHDLDEG